VRHAAEYDCREAARGIQSYSNDAHPPERQIEYFLDDDGDD